MSKSIFAWLAVVLSVVALRVVADPNLKTPYILLDPTSMPAPTAVGTPVPFELVDPMKSKHTPDDLGLPRVTWFQEGGDVQIEISNRAVAMKVKIDARQKATIVGLSDRVMGVELLRAASPVFQVKGKKATLSSDSYRVKYWRTYQYPDYAEIGVAFQTEDRGADAFESTWHVRVFRDRPQVEQRFQTLRPDVTIAQVLSTSASLEPIMPANLFGRGFSNGKPNIPDRRRFEIVSQSDHLCYDSAAKVGLWGFVADVAGSERITAGEMGLVEYPTQRGNHSWSGAFVLQPFHGSIEAGFRDLRTYINERYAVQRLSPSLYEWNQFWLWQGGPKQVSTSVVTEARLMDVLPRQLKMGMEEFHLDMGWETAPGKWELDSNRFPGGWDFLRRYIGERGLSFTLWTNDNASDSHLFTYDLISKANISRLFIDRETTEKTALALETVRTAYPGFAASCHNSTSRSSYWSWGNLHFLSGFKQIYFGEGQFWAWSNILPEAKIEEKNDPKFPQRTEAERFFSRHDLYVGDLITRSATYQANWVWPFNCTSPPHSGWAWFEDRPTEQLRDRIYSYLACKFNYQWGFDPAMLRQDLIDLHLNCTAWFKANRDLLVQYQHVLGPPDGKGIDGAAHLKDGRGFIFLFNPSDSEQSVEWKEILWEPELEFKRPMIQATDWTSLAGYQSLGQQDLSKPVGQITVPPRGVKVLGIDLDDDAILARVRAERGKIGQ